jgi:archaellum component FlaC
VRARAYRNDVASDPQLELRVSRLENDTKSIYEIITGIISTQQQHSRRFDDIDGRLDGIDGRLDGIDTRLDGIDGRLDGIDRRFDSVEATLAEVVRRLPEPS